MRKLIGCFLLFLSFSAFAEGVEFRFKHEEGAMFHIKSEVFEDVYINRVKSHYSEIVNKISGKIEKTNEGSGFLKANFFVTEQFFSGGKSYNKLYKDYRTEFWRNEFGQYDISPRFYMPVVRDVPVFPEQALFVGDQWVATGYEVHDFREVFGVPVPIKFPITVNYEYAGEEKLDGKNYDIIFSHYEINARPQNLRSSSGLLPSLFTGNVEQKIYWDSDLGHPHYYYEKFRIGVLISNGTYIEYDGIARSSYVVPEKLDKKEIIENLEGQNLENVELKETERGISITLSDIKFKADKAELIETEIDKLDKIARVLKNYPGRDLLITGHTALRGTYEGRQELSEERARVIAEFLISNNVRTKKEVFIQGKGAEEPVADNITEEGLAKNRRVEILILEN